MSDYDRRSMTVFFYYTSISVKQYFVKSVFAQTFAVGLGAFKKQIFNLVCDNKSSSLRVRLNLIIDYFKTCM